MTPNQHSYVYSHLKAILQRDFITLLPKKGLDHVAEKILCYLDANSLCAAELVCTGWLRVISEGMLWKKLIERKVQTDLLWKGLAGDNFNFFTHLKKVQLLMKPEPWSYFHSGTKLNLKVSNVCYHTIVVKHLYFLLTQNEEAGFSTCSSPSLASTIPLITSIAGCTLQSSRT